MGGVGACWDNAVVERFFSSLKHDWILKVHQPTREHMKQGVAEYIKYYNLDKLHTDNGLDNDDTILVFEFTGKIY